MHQTNFNIYKLILIFIYFVYSPNRKNLKFPVFNCYESFSSPKLIFKIFFYTPSGPDYIIADFNSYIELSNFTKIKSDQNGRYQLKRIKENCENSDIIFTTNGTEIISLQIEISFFIFKSSAALTFFDYSFQKGFKTDNYTLIDQYGSFGISVQVTHSQKRFIETVAADESEVENYLRTLDKNNYHICVVTENNNDVVIQPIFDSLKNQGYIIRIKAEMGYSQRYSQKFEFHAFSCTVDESYVDTPTVFITEGYPSLQFKAYCIQFDYSNNLVFRDIPFYFYNMNISSFFPSLILSKKFKKVFLMNNNMETKICVDKSFIVTYHSQNGTKYYEFIMKKAEIESKVKRFLFNKSSSNQRC